MPLTTSCFPKDLLCILPYRAGATTMSANGTKGNKPSSSRWSRVSLSSVSSFDESDGTDVNGSNGGAKKKRSTLLEDICQGNFDNWNPETCVQLLRMPSVQNYAGITKLIGKWCYYYYFYNAAGLYLICKGEIGQVSITWLNTISVARLLKLNAKFGY